MTILVAISNGWLFESVCWLRLFALSEGKERCKSIGEVYKMATSKDILNSFGKEANIVKAVALYLGAEIRENQEVNLRIN